MFVVVICTLILLNFDGYALAAGQIKFLNGTIPMEYVTDPVGGKHFMVFYNRFLKNKYENVTLKDSTSLGKIYIHVNRKNQDGKILCHFNDL